MKIPALLVAAVFGLASVPFSHSQVYTVPVGFVKFSPAPSVNGTTRKFTVGSFPLQGSAKWAGLVASEPSGNTLNGANASWSGYGPGASGFITHVVRFTSGGAIGRVFPISGLPSATTLTVTLPSSVTNLGTSVNANDSFEILPVNTFKSLFGATSSAVKFLPGASQSTADLIYQWNGAAWIAYWFDGAMWVSQLGDEEDFGDTPIFSDEGIWVARKSTSSRLIEYPITGTVPASASLALDIEGASGPNRKFTFVSNPFPADITLNALNLKNLPNWQSGTSQGTADIAYIWNGAAWIAYWYDGAQWVSQVAPEDDEGGTVIPAGSGVWVGRRSSSPGAESTFATVARPYSLQ